MVNNNNSNFGIDIVGYPMGQLGIGEQTRSLARIALQAGFDINLIDLFHPETDKFSNDDQDLAKYVSKSFKNNIRIFSMTQSMAAALIYRTGPDIYDCPHNIFHLAWELSQRPPQLEPAMKFADEIWGISEFTSKAFLNSYGIPVRTMPNSVTLPQFVARSRSYFKLPENRFLYSCSFDFNSFITRKNPLAVVDAFLDAFANNDQVGLVMKVSHPKPTDPIWAEIVRRVDLHANIYIIDQLLEKKDIFALYECCDAYISLHKSEGFGLAIAENMALMKPVITTGYSGNMDFCSAETNYLVEFDLEPVATGAYPFSENAFWANPKTHSAAEQMKSVFYDEQKRLRVSLAGRDQIISNFSTIALTERFSQLIQSFFKRRSILINR